MASVHNLIVKRGETEIFKNFSAEFPEHQVTAVSGRSGCGKTTLLSVLLNLLPADSGEIHGFQKPSAVFQEDRLLPYLTAAKNISVAARPRRCGRPSRMVRDGTRRGASSPARQPRPRP